MNKTPWVILLLLWMAGSAWWHVCKIKQLCPDVAAPDSTTATSELLTTPPGADAFVITDGNRFRLELPGNFSFNKSGYNVNLNSLGGSLTSLVAYFLDNPDRTLDITGYYMPSETNSTPFSNLGLARAEAMKQYLIQQRIPATALTTKGVLRNLPFNAAGDSVRGGLGFAFGEAVQSTKSNNPATPAADSTSVTANTTAAPITITEPTTEKELAQKEKFTSVFQPIDLYFPLSEANYIRTDETQKFFSEATKYLAQHKDKKLLVTGYTDNTGSPQTNMRLSLDRANDVKAKLRRSGIRASQIVVRAKGQTQPKADNRTTAGRKANRRVSVVIE